MSDDKKPLPQLRYMQPITVRIYNTGTEKFDSRSAFYIREVPTGEFAGMSVVMIDGALLRIRPERITDIL